MEYFVLRTYSFGESIVGVVEKHTLYSGNILGAMQAKLVQCKEDFCITKHFWYSGNIVANVETYILYDENNPLNTNKESFVNV